MSETMHFVRAVVMPALCGVAGGLAAYQVMSGAAPLDVAIGVGVMTLAVVVTLRPKH